MFRFRKQLISLICALAMLLCELPAYTRAEEEIPQGTNTAQEETDIGFEEEEPEIEEYVTETATEADLIEEEYGDGEPTEEESAEGEPEEEEPEEEFPEAEPEEEAEEAWPEDGEFAEEEPEDGEAAEEEEAEEEAADGEDTEEPEELNPDAEVEEPAEDFNDSEQGETEFPADMPMFIQDQESSTTETKTMKAPRPVVGYYPGVKKPVIYAAWTDALASFSNISAYELQRRTDGGKWETVATRKPSSYKPAGNNDGFFEYNDYKFTEGHVYDYRVRVLKSKKVRAVSDVSRVSALKMSKVTVKESGKGYPRIEWTKVDRATGYYIYRKQDTQSAYSSKPYRTITKGATAAFTDTKVSDGKSYDYLVIPFRKLKGNRYAGTYSNAVNFRYTAAASLRTPVIQKISQNNAGVSIQWNEISGATKYEVYAKKDGMKDWKLAGTVKKTGFTHKTNATRKGSGVYIQYRVRAIGKSGARSEFSKADKVYRLASPGVVKLSKSSTEDKVIVRWNQVAGAEEYFVYYKQTGASKYKVMKVSGDQTKTAISVTSHKEYEAYVKAAGKGFRSQRTEISHITPVWYYVFVVGESDYSRAEGCQNLSSPKFDLPALEKIFSKQTKKIKMVMNASQSEVYSGITSAFGKAGPNSVCIFVWIGHGVVRSGEKWAGALCTTDGKYIRPAELKKHMDSKVKSNHVVILLGSCGSGAFIHHTTGTEVLTGENVRAGAEADMGTEAITDTIMAANVSTEAEVSADPEAQPDADAEVEEFNNNFINTFREDENANKAGEFNNSRKYTIISGAEVDEAGSERYWYNFIPTNVINARNNPIHALCCAGGYDYCNDRGEHVGWITVRSDSNGDRMVSVKEAYQYARTLVESHMQFWSSEPNLILFQLGD